MKTIICDIDGTLLDYQHDTIPHAGHTRDHTALPGVVKRCDSGKFKVVVL